MSNNPAANARTLSEASDGQTPLSGLYREVGLAAVANELNLQLNTLEPVLLQRYWLTMRGGGGRAQPAWPLMRRCRTSRR